MIAGSNPSEETGFRPFCLCCKSGDCCDELIIITERHTVCVCVSVCVCECVWGGGGYVCLSVCLCVCVTLYAGNKVYSPLYISVLI